ncbi:hypothetical protein FG379_002150 [Cryptosporidium bovis]|uniref:uncharacterized protein n=1 Tax=Cryptosporidium bovis TaxID=310047 RepID=UPI00351A5C06|nr:hypothetical protein FG379_002150 [Cryptosporidium bovis]
MNIKVNRYYSFHTVDILKCYIIIVLLFIFINCENLIRVDNSGIAFKKKEFNLGEKINEIINRIKSPKNENQKIIDNRLIIVYSINDDKNESLTKLRLKIKTLFEKLFNGISVVDYEKLKHKDNIQEMNNCILRYLNNLKMEIIETNNSNQLVSFLKTINMQLLQFENLIMGVYLDEYIGFEEKDTRSFINSNKNLYLNSFSRRIDENISNDYYYNDNNDNYYYSALYSKQWFHSDSKYGIKSAKMWKKISELKNKGIGNIVIAVFDSGIDFEHPDLRGKIWRNFGEYNCNDGIDDDMNGYIDDCYGWNFVNNNKIPIDDNGHGTHISGIISGIPNSIVGISGICWYCQIMVLKVLDSKIRGLLSGFVQAIDYALDKGVRISNHSYGSRSKNIELLRLAIKRSEEQGMLVIVASGNFENERNNDLVPTYPSSFRSDNIISVTSITSNGELMERATYGKKSVHVGAPGVNICSTYLNGEYRCMDGSSFSAPIVTGIAGVLLSLYPNISIYSLKDCILKGVVKIKGLPAPFMNE